MTGYRRSRMTPLSHCFALIDDVAVQHQVGGWGQHQNWHLS